MSKSPLLDHRLVPMGSVKEDMLKRDPGVLQFQGTKSPRDQRARKHSTLDLERTRLKVLLTQGSIKLI